MPTESIIDELHFHLLCVPILANIDKEHLHKIAVEATLEFFPTGSTVFREGDYNFDFYIILQGMVKMQSSSASGNEYLNSLGRNQFFGEMGSLSCLPRSETIITETPSYILKIPHELFHELLDSCPTFKESIDQRYRTRAIFFHLLLSPIFTGLSKQNFSVFAKATEFVLYQKGEFICRQGEVLDGFYMIRRGYAQVFRKEGKVEKTIAYLTENMPIEELSLRELSLPPKKTWEISVRALTQVEVIKISKTVFETCYERDPNFRTSQVAKLKRQEQEGGQSAEGGNLDILVKEGLIQARNAILINLDECIRCNRCVEACQHLHGDASRLIRRKGFRYQNWLIASSCYNCQSPDCMIGCKVSAIRRDRSGHIHVIESKCVGCGQCVSKCPYSVIQLVQVPEDNKRETTEDKVKGKAETQEKKQSAIKVKKKAIICDQCINLGIPACLHNCPVGAIYRGDPTKLLE